MICKFNISRVEYSQENAALKKGFGIRVGTGYVY
jgi:hypothetical protein